MDQERKTAMDDYAGLDVSLEETSVCVVDGDGAVVHEARCAGGS